MYSTYLWNYKRYTRAYTCWSLFPSSFCKSGMRNGRIMRHIARFESALPDIWEEKAVFISKGICFDWLIAHCFVLQRWISNISISNIEKFNLKCEQPLRNIRQFVCIWFNWETIYSDSYFYLKSLIISSCKELTRSNADGISSEINLRVSWKYVRINHKANREIKLHNVRTPPLLIRDTLLLALKFAARLFGAIGD